VVFSISVSSTEISSEERLIIIYASISSHFESNGREEFGFNTAASKDGSSASSNSSKGALSPPMTT